ncbi:MAG: 7-cyano-7-deazaguanine synthase [bacterium]|nr:7-cyano-7-deazaguanine synthase [bacterium]
MQKVKALVLLSGGLDSMLAAKILMEQGIEVVGLSFKSCFFGTDKAKKVAEQLGIKLIEIDFSKEHLAMLKSPAHGYGKNMNPCIDCHGLMLKKAKKIMEENLFDFVATGEVLGQRPMSQHRDALKIVEKIAGLTGKLVRPMSAKLLDESEPEKLGKINREKLLDISGRSRDRQLELVKKYNILEYSKPGGGCVLTDPTFSKKLIKMFEYWPDCNENDIAVLKNGRNFWFNALSNNKILAIIGREKEDNENLLKLKQSNDVIIELADFAGPISLIRAKNFKLEVINKIQEIDVPEEIDISKLKFDEEKSFEEILKIVALLTSYYVVKARGKRVNVITN